ncbi:HD-GYP domain-containing protein [Sphingosinicella sp. CPCC 101087]|uniref:HD-GYP domain-containing protein n=1 Tax=Sphingosinicella sp. CPCC 101087 TaxID=2497754 RepID=UPI0013ECA028|nr:HD-GYP domain-containing protein [Sphingosinicella sp. CPCC 101087]
MLRVRKEDLRLGMYIQSLEGSWFDHPFWRTKFLLTEEEDLRALQGSGIDTILVDEAKSLAPAVAHLAPQEPARRSSLFEELAPGDPQLSAPAAAEPRRRRVPRVDEYRAAQAVVEDCKAAVGELFAQIRRGNASAVEDAAPLISGIAESVERNPDALITLSRVRTLDEYTYMHSVAVSALMINLARQLHLPAEYVAQAGTAGLFMDVGKGLLPPALLGKPGLYSPEERAQMQRHPQLGAEAVKSAGELSSIVADVCLHHHERYDGSGYPHGLKGDDISLFARMAAICDTYDALASERPHRPAFGPAEAVAEMYRVKGQFDEGLLTTFIKSIGIYPVGSLVRLESRRLGCVVAQRRDRLTRPLVRVFYSVAQRSHLPVEELDLAQEPEPDRIVAREEPGRWGLADWDRFALTIIQGQKAKRAA